MVIKDWSVYKWKPNGPNVHDSQNCREKNSRIIYFVNYMQKKQGLGPSDLAHLL